MARKSTIETLPSDILEQLQALLRDPRCTRLEITAEINALLEKEGHDDRISASSLNRYAKRMDQVGEKLRQSRQIADMWIGKLGAAPQGQIGQLVNELVRNLAFDTALKLSEGDEPVEPKLLKELAIAVERLEKAASENEKRRREIEAEARRQALEEAAQRVDEAAKAKGLDEDQARFWREKVLMGV